MNESNSLRDCERKAIIQGVAIVRNVDPFGDIRQDIRSKLQDDIAEALLSESLIVQKRVEDSQLTLEILRMENKKIGGTLAAICKLLKDDGSENRYFDQADMQKQIDSLQKRVDELWIDLAVVRGANADLRKQIDELKQQLSESEACCRAIKANTIKEIDELTEKIQDQKDSLSLVTMERDVEIKRARESEARVDELTKGLIQ